MLAMLIKVHRDLLHIVNAPTIIQRLRDLVCIFESPECPNGICEKLPINEEKDPTPECDSDSFDVDSRDNWVEDRIECPKTGTFYFPPKEEIDHEKMKPQSRQPDFRQNKLNSTQSNVASIIRHDSHDKCPNYATTNDLVYNHLPKPLCGPGQRYYKRAKHQFYPQPDLMKCFGNVTEWGLRKNLQYEWKCTDVSDYISTVYEDTYAPPQLHQYLPQAERRARNSSFTKSFRYKMTKSK